MNGVQQQNEFNVEQTLIIKGVAICLLLWHHLYYENPERTITYIIAYYGKVCVAIFLILSGYGLMKSSSKYNSCLGLIKDKLKKLYLNYWLIWLLFVPFGVLVLNISVESVYGENYMIKLIIDLMGMKTIVFGFYGYNPTWWFMGLIIGFYIIFPLLYKVLVKYPRSSLVCSFFIMLYPVFCRLPFGGDMLGNYAIWIFPFVLGMYLAHSNMFEKFHSLNINRYIKLIIYTVSLLLLMALRIYGGRISGVRSDGLIGFIICIITFEYISKIKYLNTLFKFIGKHSFNIFLFHSFIYYIYFRNHIYSFQNDIIIFIVLLIESLLISIIIEKIKKIIDKIFSRKKQILFETAN